MASTDASASTASPDAFTLSATLADHGSTAEAPSLVESALQGLRRRANADALVLALREDRTLAAAGGFGLQRLGSECVRALLAADGLARRVMAEERGKLAGVGVEALAAAEVHALRGTGMRVLAVLPLIGFSGRRGVVLLLFRQQDPRRLESLEGWTDRAAHVIHALEYTELRWRHESDRRLAARIHEDLERRVHRGEARRRALIHILSDTNRFNRRLSDQRKAMLHIMGDLHETTLEVQRRENALRDKQEQLVQAGKLATLGELTTGMAHELNNPLNNIGLAIGNVMDLAERGRADNDRVQRELGGALQQVRKATEIITHLRTFGRAAPVILERVSLNEVVERSLGLLQEQLRLREIRVIQDLSAEPPMVLGNPIQLEQVTINLVANARDALAAVESREIVLSTSVRDQQVELAVEDSGPGIPDGLERRIFDPFFTTKDVGSGTGLGLSITYGILREHGGSIQVRNVPGRGARFEIRLPRALLASDRSA